MSTRLEMYRGDTRFIQVTTTVEGLPSADVRFTAKRSTKDTDLEAIISKVSGIGIDVVDYIAVITIDPTDTILLSPQTLVWDVQVTDSSGQVQTIADGTLRIKADISRTAP